jgi:hypothetical protein
MLKISGVVCLAVGGLLVYWGYHMAHAVGGEINNLVTGSPGDKPMLLYIGGAILLIAGFGQVVRNSK